MSWRSHGSGRLFSNFNSIFKKIIRKKKYRVYWLGINLSDGSEIEGYFEFEAFNDKEALEKFKRELRYFGSYLTEVKDGKDVKIINFDNFPMHAAGKPLENLRVD